MQAIKVGHGNRVEWHEINDIKMVNESPGSRLAQKIGISGQFRAIIQNHLEKEQ